MTLSRLPSSMTARPPHALRSGRPLAEAAACRNEFKALLPVPQREDAELLRQRREGFIIASVARRHGDAIRWLTDQRGSASWMPLGAGRSGGDGGARAGPESRRSGPERAAGLHEVRRGCRRLFLGAAGWCRRCGGARLSAAGKSTGPNAGVVQLSASLRQPGKAQDRAEEIRQRQLIDCVF